MNITYLVARKKSPHEFIKILQSATVNTGKIWQNVAKFSPTRKNLPEKKAKNESPRKKISLTYLEFSLLQKRY